MRVARAAAIIFTALTAGVVAFQLALALGAPWGSYAMGGAYPGVYPPAMRLAAVVQAALLTLIALVVLSRSGLALKRWSRASAWAIWLVVAFSALSVLLNAITPSAGERAVWVPVALLLLLSSLTVAMVARRHRQL
jgi:hypothetical protein